LSFLWFFEKTKIGDSLILIFPKTWNWKFYNYENFKEAKPPTI
jgi:aminoglycoside N3'-acetyltransferase